MITPDRQAAPIVPSPARCVFPWRNRCWMLDMPKMVPRQHLASSFGFTTPDLPAVGNVQLGRIGMKVKSDFHTQDGIGVEP